MKHDEFDELQSYYERNSKPRILGKFMRYAKYLSDREKLYMEFVMDSLFVADVNFSETVKKEMQRMMEETNQMLYIQFLFLSKKALVQLRKNVIGDKVSESRLDNYEFFFNEMFQTKRKIGKMNSFGIYSILQFAKSIESDTGAFLIQRFRGLPLINDFLFWKSIFLYIKNNLHRHSAKTRTEEAAPDKINKSFMKSLTSFFKSKAKIKEIKTITKEDKSINKNKSFQEIAGLLFRIGLEFKEIVMILIKLSLKFAVDAGLLERIVVRNKTILFHQLLQKNKLIDSIQALRNLKSRRMVRSYRSIVHQKDPAPLNESLQEVDLADSMVQFGGRDGQRLSKILTVVKLSLGFLVGKYDEQNQLVRMGGSFRKVRESQEKENFKKDPFNVENIASISIVSDSNAEFCFINGTIKAN